MTVCTSCGQANSDQARYCQSCGSPLPIGGTGLSPHTRIGAKTYAGFWVRAGAFVIDWVFLAVVLTVLAMMSSVGVIFGLAIPWIYEALMLSGERQATLGKMALGIVITDSAGGRLTFGRATGRHFAKYLSSLLFGIGFIMAAFTERKQALHDFLAQSLAVLS